QSVRTQPRSSSSDNLADNNPARMSSATRARSRACRTVFWSLGFGILLGFGIWDLGFSFSLFAATSKITIDPAHAGPRLNPRMYGIFLEEINFGVDGGLYAELIRNRGFEDAKPPEGFTFRYGKWQDEKGYDARFSRIGYVTK